VASPVLPPPPKGYHGRLPRTIFSGDDVCLSRTAIRILTPIVIRLTMNLGNFSSKTVSQLTNTALTGFTFVAQLVVSKKHPKIGSRRQFPYFLRRDSDQEKQQRGEGRILTG